MERNQTLSIALGTAGVGCTLAYLAYSHWENDGDKNLINVSTDDVGTEVTYEEEAVKEVNEDNKGWFNFLFTNSNTENEAPELEKIGEDSWQDAPTLKPENKKMESSAMKDLLKKQYEANKQ